MLLFSRPITNSFLWFRHYCSSERHTKMLKSFRKKKPYFKLYDTNGHTYTHTGTRYGYVHLGTCLIEANRPLPLPRATPRPRPSSSSSPSLASTSFQTLELDSPLKTLTLGTPRLPPSVYPSAPRRPSRLPRPALQLGPRGPRVSPGLELLVRSLRWAGGCGQVAWWAGRRGRRRWMEMR